MLLNFKIAIHINRSHYFFDILLLSWACKKLVFVFKSRIFFEGSEGLIRWDEEVSYPKWPSNTKRMQVSDKRVYQKIFGGKQPPRPPL